MFFFPPTFFFPFPSHPLWTSQLASMLLLFLFWSPLSFIRVTYMSTDRDYLVLPMATPLRKTVSPPQAPLTGKSSSDGQGPLSSFLTHAGALTDPSGVGLRQVIRAAFRRLSFAALPRSYGSYTFPHPSAVMLPSLVGSLWTSRAKHEAVTYSQHLDQMWVSEFTSIYCKQ